MSQNEQNKALGNSPGEFENLPIEEQLTCLRAAVKSLINSVELLADVHELAGRDKAETLHTARVVAGVARGIIK